MVSARFSVLSAPLNSTVSVCSEAICGQTCGQKALLDQVRHQLPPPVQKGSFSYSGFGYCTSGEGELQRFSLPLSGALQTLFHAQKKESFSEPKPPKACVAISKNRAVEFQRNGMVISSNFLRRKNVQSKPSKYGFFSARPCSFFFSSGSPNQSQASYNIFCPVSQQAHWKICLARRSSVFSRCNNGPWTN